MSGILSGCQMVGAKASALPRAQAAALRTPCTPQAQGGGGHVNQVDRVTLEIPDPVVVSCAMDHLPIHAFDSEQSATCILKTK
jgi:hypothetical protein